MIIKKINNFFDYIYYRTARLDKNQGAGTSGGHIPVAAIQSLFFIEFLASIIVLIGGRSFMKMYISEIKYIAICIIFIFIAYNYFKYKDKYEVFNKKWENEKKAKKIRKGILIVLIHIIAFFLFVPLSYVI